jgi:hypothetical protein
MVGYKQLWHGGFKRGVRELANKITMKGKMDTSITMVCLKNYNQDLGSLAHNLLCKTFYTLLLIFCLYMGKLK